jgi:TetR/AcrR family transcriptional regulator
MPARTSSANPGERDERPDPPTREAWAERVADRSPSVQRSRDRSVEQARSIVAAARRLAETKGPSFTTQELIKEAGIALQTFYRYFPGKDSLLLAVIEDAIEEACSAYREQAATLSDPVEKLRFYVTATIRGLDAPGNGPSFITSEHFRLQTLYPDEVSRATRHFTDLLVEEIGAAMAAGRVHPQDPRYSAWLITQLTMAVFHHYDCAGVDEPTDDIAQKLWEFCFTAVNGEAPKGG